MTEIVFKNARLIDPVALTDTIGWIHIRGGKIIAKGDGDAPSIENKMDCAGQCLAPGIVDLGVRVGEPGERHKESFRTAGLAASAGGVTTIVTRPDTEHPIDTPETLEFLLRRAADDTPVNVLSMATLTKNRAGKEMTEIGFLLDAGAVAFSDGMRVVEDTKVFVRALSYARSLGALVIGHIQEPGLSRGGVATKGKFASLRGLPDISPLAERMGLDRDIAMLEMTGAAYHVDQVTTARALPALERAKRNGLDITAGVSIHHLTLNEFDVADYRTFFKFTPPLRSEEDRIEVIKAVSTGLIDIICSFHTPQDEESKRLPFEDAASGAVGLETLLPAALRLVHSGDLTLPRLFRAISLNPSNRLGLPSGRLNEGAPADLILFDPDAPFILDRFGLRSKSKNTPFDSARMQGKIVGTWVAGERVYTAQSKDKT